MDWKALFEKLKALLTKEGATPDELKAELEKDIKKEEPPKVDLDGLHPEVKKALEQQNRVIEALTGQNKELLAALNEEKEARKKSVENANAQAEAVRIRKRDEWVKKHTDEGRIAAQNADEKAKWEKLYDADSANAEFVISKIKGKTEPDAKKDETPADPKAFDEAALRKEAEAEFQAAIKAN